MAAATGISRREGLRAPRPAAVLHLTLCKIGNYGRSASVIETARRIGAGIVCQGFDVSLTRLMHFQGAGAVVLACDEAPAELARLNNSLVRALRRDGFKPPAGFKPHMTFVYENHRLLPEALLPQPILWSADAFELVSSPSGETRHEILGCWPLT